MRLLVASLFCLVSFLYADNSEEILLDNSIIVLEYETCKNNIELQCEKTRGSFNEIVASGKYSDDQITIQSNEFINVTASETVDIYEINYEEVIEVESEVIENIQTLYDTEIIEIEYEGIDEDEIFELEKVVKKDNFASNIKMLPDAKVIEVIYEDKTFESNQDMVNQTNIQESAENIKLLDDAKIVEIIYENNLNVDQNKAITVTKYIETPISIDSSCRTEIKKKIDFWNLLDQTMLNATNLILKEHDIDITQKNLNIVKSEYYPSISLGYLGEYYHGYDRGNGSSIGGQFYPGYSQYRDSLSLDLQHELYRFGATDLKMQISQKDIEIVKSELELEKERVSKDLLNYFTQAVRAQESYEFRDDMRLVQDRIIQKKQRLFESDQISRTVVLKDQLTLANLEKNILKDKLNFSDAIKNIQILTNINLDPNLVKFEIPNPKNKEIVAFEHSATAKNIKLKLEKKFQELELIKKDYKPTIYANGGYRFYGADDDSFTRTIENLEKNSWDIGVSLRWDLFSGFKTDSTVEKTKVETQKLVEQYKLAKVDFEAKERKRELLKQSIDKILRVEAQILDQTCQQEDMFVRLESVGQISSIELDNVEISKLKSKLEFRLGVIDRVYESISSELTL